MAFDETLGISQDYDLILRVSEAASASCTCRRSSTNGAPTPARPATTRWPR
ncbi:hypothetical protein [Comamonas sp. JC664]|uniref:hypothetical protein n=1 Tax=Comamonas sp. JC664 TaxID=2801917 RepID=UPI00360DC3A1